MDVDQIEKNLLAKIRNGDSNFTDEDYVIISHKPYLKRELFIAIAQKKIPCSSKLEDLVFEYVLTETELNTFPTEILSSGFYEYLKYLLENGTYGFEMIDFLRSINIDEETIKNMEQLIETKLNDPSIKFNKLDLSIDTIKSLLDHKRYDDIKNIKIYCNYNNYVNRELYERILKEWPYDKKPYIIVKYEIQNNIYDYSKYDDLDDLIVLYDSFTSYKDIKNKIINAIIEKLRSAPDLSKLINNYRFMVIMDDYCSNDPTKKAEISKILFDNNCLTSASYLLQNGLITKEQYDEKINYCIENDIELPNDILEKDFYYKDERRIKQILKFGKLDLLINRRIDFNDSEYEDLLKENEQYIVDQINNNNPYYEKFTTNISFNIRKYPLITNAILEKGKVKYLDFNLIDLSLLSADKFVELLEKDGSLVFNVTPDSIELIDKVILKLINEKKYKYLFSKNLLSEIYIEDNEDIILKELDNLVFADMLIKYNFVNIKNNKKIINKLLSNNLFVESIIDLIVHDEYLMGYYNDETYNIIKDYYVSKYNYNREHLDIVEKTLGPKIIRYLSNDNLSKIVNLDDESFNKVMRLFPVQEYTMKDLEAGFESLIQYLYGKKNIEDITIFPSLIHAIEDNNLNEIKRIKESLIIYTKPEFIDSICKKYNLDSVKDIEDLLNLIIQKYSTEEREKYLVILHEITNEYILTSRENYRNNHFFEAKYPMYFNYLGRIIEAIDSGDKDEYSVLVATVASKLDEKFYKNFSMGENIPEELKNKMTLMNFIVEQIKNPNTRNKYLPILKEAVDYFYKVEKNKHIKEIALGEELSLPYSLDEKSKVNEGIRYVIEHCYNYYDENLKSIFDIIVDILKEQGIEKSLVYDCISYYSGDKRCQNDLSLVQKTMPIVIRTATSYVSKNNVYDGYKRKIDTERVLAKLDTKYKIKRIYSLENTSDPYLILLNLNVDLLKTGLFKNEELYNKLVSLMNKKKLHLLPENLKKMFDDCGISSDYSDIASFINFFGPILESEVKKLEASGKDPEQALSGLASIMINAETYSSISNVYSQILGERDSKLIKSNPGPNSAIRKIENNQRLKEAIKMTINNFKRQEVTIPTFDTNVSFMSDDNEKKELNVIVGNFTDPCNLTHGERTGACMRIGGVGETLFNFCLSDPNGFHIRFEDPETHEYISRVSGFRNGNTVFLNELRYSCNKDKYNDSDVVKACENTAELLIELSKDSECPIENVVISNQYAMMVSKKDEENLNIEYNKEGLPNFYSDVGTYAIILATSAVDKKFVPINFDKTKVPTYKPCRSKPLVLTSEKELIGKINRVASIKSILSGIDYEDVGRMEFDNGIICGVVSDDWYIYVDKEKNINYDFIDIDERAKKEVQQYLAVIDDIINKAENEKEEMESEVYGL